MVEERLDIDQILEILPHRYPFLLIDKVLKRVRHEDLSCFDDAYIICRKNVSVNEPFFEGHFPNNPIMPGVLQIEAMAQAAALLVVTSNLSNSNTTLITGVDGAKFRAPVVPSDVLKIEARVLRSKSNVYVFSANISKEGDIKVSEAKITAYLATNKSK